MTITTLRPDADAYQTNISKSTGTAMWSLIDDTPVTDTTYIYSAANSYPQVHEFILNFPNTLSVSASQRIKSAKIRLRGKQNVATTYPVTCKVALRNPVVGKIDYTESFIATSTAYKDFEGVLRTKPPPGMPDGSAWTLASGHLTQVYGRFYDAKISSTVSVGFQLSELYLDFDIRTLPTVTPVTVTGNDSSTSPTVDWTFNANADGDKQKQYRVKVFSAAQYGAAGFNPETSVPVWDSGNLTGSATSAVVGASLLNGVTYKAYVRVAIDVNGIWWTGYTASSAFVIQLTPLPTPTMTVTPETTVPQYRNRIAVQANINALSAQDASADDAALGVGGWTAWFNGSVARSTAQQAYGLASLAMTATAAGNVGIRTATGVSSYRVRPLQQYTAVANFRAATTARDTNAGMQFNDITGTPIGSVVYGTNIADSTANFNTQAFYTVVAPANAWSVTIYLRVVAAAAGEVHYADKIGLLVGSSTTWSPGGYLSGVESEAVNSVVVEYAWATKLPRNLASMQLWSGGDTEKNADGFYVTGTNSAAEWDMAEQYHGAGSIRWDVLDTTSKLYLGKAGAVDADDLAPEHALVGVPGRVYTVGVRLKASQAFSSALVLQATDRDNTAVGSPVSASASITTAWQQFTATITMPSGGVYIRAQLDNTASVVDRRVWVDAVQMVLGTSVDTEPARAGGVPLVWKALRGADVGDLVPTAASGDQVSYVHDMEAPPGFTVLYRARNYVPPTSLLPALSSDLTAYVPTMMDPPGPGIWLLRDPNSFVDVQRVHIVGETQQVAEDAAVFHPIRTEQFPVVVSDWMGGEDGNLEFLCDDQDEWDHLLALLRARRTLFLIRPEFGGVHIRFMERSWAKLTPRTGVGRASIWRRDPKVSYLETDRPPW